MIQGSQGGNEVIRARAVARVDLVPALVRLVQEATTALGLSTDDASRFGLLVEEACVNVVQHAFEPGESGDLEVVVERRPNQVVVAVEDRGLPFDVAQVESGKRSGFGALLMRTFADEVSFTNLGRRGKRVELVKRLPSREVGELLSEDERRRGGSEVDRAPDDLVPALRLMRADEEDAVGLARCVYRSYGYSYPVDVLYYPDRVLEQMKNGLVESCVALAPDGEIVGHLALVKEGRHDRVADSARAVVDPRFRGRHLFETMKGFLVDHGTRAGLLGLYSEAVTVHPFTQKGNLALGAHETGYLLAFVPQTTLFKKIAGGEQSQRQTVCLFYLPLNPEPHREVFVTPRHAEVLSRIYGVSGLDRTVTECGAAVPELANSEVGLTVINDMAMAVMRVNAAGTDLVDVVRYRLRELCQQGVEVIQLELSLGDRAAAVAVPALEELGFYFCGVIPEFLDGDVLRMQYLNNVAFDPSLTTTVSEFAKELYAYVIGEHDRAAERRR